MKEQFIQFCLDNKIELNLTSSQAIFLDLLLEHTDKISGIGDMNKPLRALQSFINQLP